jgi:hypothetical protein
MSCNCCENIYELGCYASSVLVEFPMEILDTKDYTISLMFNGRMYNIPLDLVTERLYLNLANVLSSYTYVDCKIYDEDGTLIVYTLDRVDYDCFKFQTILSC